MKTAVQNGKLGRDDELAAIRRLDEQARAIENEIVKGPSVEEIIAHETEVSSQYGGKSVFGIEK